MNEEISDTSKNDGIESSIQTDSIADHLYDIALDPEYLVAFIEAWNAAGFDNGSVRQEVKEIDSFDSSFARHLQRAEAFLERSDDRAISSLSGVLDSFEDWAAMILDQSLTIVALNSAAGTTLGVSLGGQIQDMPFEADQLEMLRVTFRKELQTETAKANFLKLTDCITGKPLLFHTRRLPPPTRSTDFHILVVSTQYVWRSELDETLMEVYELTRAELGILRALVEGGDAKTIAKTRGTSEGTVRVQIKSVLSKMNANSQSEVIRIVMSLRGMISMPMNLEPLQENAMVPTGNWLQSEAEKPFKSITLPDGRRLDYHDQGPPDGAPVLFSHMGYGQLRWSASMLKLAFEHRLRVICPVRAGYGMSSKIDPKADLLAITRTDTLCLMDHLGLERLPYVVQGNDLLFAVDLAAERADRVSEIIGICARPWLPGDQHYAQMGKWHRFFLSTAKHSPHLLYVTTKAAFSLARKIGVRQMFLSLNSRSAADARLSYVPEVAAIMEQSASELITGKNADASQAYSMEILASEADWSERIRAAKEVPIWSINGAEDPALDISVIAEYRAHYPWIIFEIIHDAGQMLMFQHPALLIPRIAAAAHRAASESPLTVPASQISS